RTLLPYTTLFRSRRAPGRGRGSAAAPGQEFLEGNGRLVRVGLLRDLPGAHQGGQLGSGAGDAFGEVAGGRTGGAAGTAPVLGRRVHGGRDDVGAQVGEQRAHRVVDGQRVPLGAARRAQQHRLAFQGVPFQDVEERLEQAAVGGV